MVFAVLVNVSKIAALDAVDFAVDAAASPIVAVVSFVEAVAAAGA